ncbi:MAG: hypothetical protein IT495_17165 [Gammaproteobacteria bacterium]|nr:hypothetical protein [Gammaproteobacteria bacterium]
MIAALLPLLGQVLDRIIPDPVERDKARAELTRAEQAGEFKELDSRMAAIVMEAQSQDPWTSRARPSFMYVMYLMILWSIPMGFLAALQPQLAQAVIEGQTQYLRAIPSEMWALFGAGYIGYVQARSADKARVLGHEPRGLLSRVLG